MKKFLILLLLMLSFGVCKNVFCLETDNIKFYKVKEQKRISKIGTQILNANRIENRMMFYYSTKSTVNANSNCRTRKITVYEGLLMYIDSDDELAGILAHEISHGVDSYKGIFRGTLSHIPYSLAPRKYEKLADKRAIDYMVKAGYNPLAMIVIMNKIGPQYRFEFPLFSSHPLTSRRLAWMYEYIFTKYPEFLVDNQYKDNIYYQNFLLTSTQNRLKFQEKVKNKKYSGNNVRYK